MLIILAFGLKLLKNPIIFLHNLCHFVLLLKYLGLFIINNILKKNLKIFLDLFLSIISINHFTKSFIFHFSV